jgi:LNS2 (Lipin/Ned1/Smp2)
MSNPSRLPFCTFLIAVGCAANPDSELLDDDLVRKPVCPTVVSSEVQALKAIAAQAELCAIEPPSTPDTSRDWVRGLVSPVVSSTSPNHRGRDNLYPVGAPQWVLGKFSYGVADKDLKGEAVDVFVQRGCNGAWEQLRFNAPLLTTTEGEHATVEGIEDTGGRVYALVPEAQKLGIGRHRIRMVVAGDQSYADQFVEILPKGTSLFVSDVDGTLTERRPEDPAFVCDEESDFPALWRSLGDSGAQPKVHEGVAQTFQSLAQKGYRPLYLTARPEWLVPHTRAFLKESSRADGRGNLPQGTVQTTLGLTGAFNAAAEAFKKEAVQRIVDKGFNPVFGFGNRQSDVATYKAMGVPFAYYFENPDTSARSCSKITDLPLRPRGPFQRGNWRIRAYTELGPSSAALAPICR